MREFLADQFIAGALRATRALRAHFRARAEVFSGAAKEQGVTPDVITKAANSANLRTNGKTGRDRRIDPASLIEWSLKRADA